MSEKGPDAFRTISEVADELDLPQHVLRFWETKFSQIRPLKRSSGRRFYRPEDVVLLRSIREMLYGQGYTIRGVQKLLKERGRIPVTEAVPAEAVAPVDDHPFAHVAEQSPSTQGAFNLTPLPPPTRINADVTAALHAVVAELRDCVAILREARNA